MSAQQNVHLFSSSFFSFEIQSFCKIAELKSIANLFHQSTQTYQFPPEIAATKFLTNVSETNVAETNVAETNVA